MPYTASRNRPILFGIGAELDAAVVAADLKDGWSEEDSYRCDLLDNTLFVVHQKAGQPQFLQLSALTVWIQAKSPRRFADLP